jgi:APA family basic amino acid/polyamine antiporter
MNLFIKKPISQLIDSAQGGEYTLKRSLSALNLVSLGIGAIIGAGLFTLTGMAASENAGPAVVLSFVVAAIGCAFAGMCYSELASMIPVAGSAYTYAYATMGEFIAWIIGVRCRGRGLVRVCEFLFTRFGHSHPGTFSGLSV